MPPESSIFGENCAKSKFCRVENQWFFCVSPPQARKNKFLFIISKIFLFFRAFWKIVWESVQRTRHQMFICFGIWMFFFGIVATSPPPGIENTSGLLQSLRNLILVTKMPGFVEKLHLRVEIGLFLCGTFCWVPVFFGTKLAPSPMAENLKCGPRNSKKKSS